MGKSEASGDVDQVASCLETHCRHVVCNTQLSMDGDGKGRMDADMWTAARLRTYGLCATLHMAAIE